MTLLLNHHVSTNAVADLFQHHIYDFYSMWIDLFDNEGITNYVLGNGCMLYVIKKCG